MTPLPSPEISAPRASGVRHVVVTLTTLMAVFLYLDRVCLAMALRYIQDDLGLTSAEAATLLSAFFWSYALAQVPAGWLSDRYGVRRMLTLYLITWSLFTGVMGLATSLAAVLLLRFGCGLAQAGAFPASGGLLSRWVPFSERALAAGIVSTGGRVGGFIAPVLTAYLIVAFLPADTPALLDADDILRPAEFVKNLGKTGDQPGQRLAAVIRGEIPADQASVLSSPSISRERLADVLNGVLHDPQLYERIEPGDFPLPAEARRLAQVPPEQLRERDVLRRNRLLLESAYPDDVGKLYAPGWRPVMAVYGLGGAIVAGFFWLLVRDRPEEHPRCNAAEQDLILAGRPATATTAAGVARRLPLASLLRSRGLWLSSVQQFGTNFGWIFILTWFPNYLADLHVPVEARGWLASVPLCVGMFGMLAGGWFADRLVRWFGLRWGRALPMSLTRFTAMAAFLACLGLESPLAITIALAVVAVSTDLGTPACWAYMQDAGGKHVGSVLGWGNMWGNLGAAVSPLVLDAARRSHGWNAAFLVCALAFFVSGIAGLGIDATIPIVTEKDE
jgi:sugar phosphate permease